MSGYGKITPAALAIIPGPAGTLTFLRQQRGPYAGHWLLPGGRIEFGEPAPDAARREALEESGCDLADLVPTGGYEMHGEWAGGRYHLIMFAFLATAEYRVAPDFEGDGVGTVVQRHPTRLSPHPTAQRILTDAGVADYPLAQIESGLSAAGIQMLTLFKR